MPKKVHTHKKRQRSKCAGKFHGFDSAYVTITIVAFLCDDRFHCRGKTYHFATGMSSLDCRLGIDVPLFRLFATSGCGCIFLISGLLQKWWRWSDTFDDCVREQLRKWPLQILCEVEMYYNGSAFLLVQLWATSDPRVLTLDWLRLYCLLVIFLESLIQISF